jgi:hypothetical protein
MNRQAIQHWGFVALVLCLLPRPVFAAVYVPPGLNPGDMYHLAFVSRDGRDALSADILDYNSFVTAQAALNPALTGTGMGVDWFAIASTQAVDARDNAVIGANVPIYLLDGTKIASGYADVWGDQSLDAPLNVTQFGVQTLETMSWTGSESSGQEYVIVPSGSVALGNSIGAAGLGNPQVSNFTWNWSGTDFKERSHPLYALSEALTAPIPEPSSLLLGLAGVSVLLCQQRRLAFRR